MSNGRTAADNVIFAHAVVWRRYHLFGLWRAMERRRSGRTTIRPEMAQAQHRAGQTFLEAISNGGYKGESEEAEVMAVIESNLQVFSNGVEWVVAESLDDALDLLPYPRSDMDDYELENWGPTDLDATFTIWIEDDDGATDERVAAHGEGKLIERTWREWLQIFGKGYICTTEY